MPPQLIINNCNIRYVSSSKVLGLIIDENLDFSEHAIQKLNECNKKWGLITRNTTRKRKVRVMEYECQDFWDACMRALRKLVQDRVGDFASKQ